MRLPDKPIPEEGQLERKYRERWEGMALATRKELEEEERDEFVMCKELFKSGNYYFGYKGEKRPLANKVNFKKKKIA